MNNNPYEGSLSNILQRLNISGNESEAIRVRRVVIPLVHCSNGDIKTFDVEGRSLYVGIADSDPLDVITEKLSVLITTCSCYIPSLRVATGDGVAVHIHVANIDPDGLEVPLPTAIIPDVCQLDVDTWMVILRECYRRSMFDPDFGRLGMPMFYAHMIASTTLGATVVELHEALREVEGVLDITSIEMAQWMYEFFHAK